MRRRTLLAVLAVWGVADANAAIQVSEDIKRSVVFLYGENSDGTTGACSAFLVGVPSSKVPSVVHTYLVTARHCLRDKKTGPYYARVHVRLNLRAGGTQVIRTRITPEGLGRNVHLHPDQDVDLAVIEFRVDPTSMDVRVIPPELLTDRESLDKAQITEGTWGPEGDPAPVESLADGLRSSRRVVGRRDHRHRVRRSRPGTTPAIVWAGTLAEDEGDRAHQAAVRDGLASRTPLV